MSILYLFGIARCERYPGTLLKHSFFCLGEFESSFLRAFADSILTSFMDAFLVIFLVMVQSYVSTPEASNLPLRVFNKHVTWTLLRIREQGFCCAGSTFFGVGQDKHRIEMN